MPLTLAKCKIKHLAAKNLNDTLKRVAGILVS